jgi:glycosyltransferase involved in cell wall biosynthesis
LHVVLDVSRILECVLRASPSGIDRVEMAYARRWLSRPVADCTFTAQSIWGWFAALPRAEVAGLIAALDLAWTRGSGMRDARRIAGGLQLYLAAGRGRALLHRRIREARPSVFLLVSHRALDRAGCISALRDSGALFVPLIHDLIPLTHPEYQRPKQAARHAARVATTAALSAAVIVNSAATERALVAQVSRHGARLPPITVAPLGIHAPPRTAEAAPAEPYFVILGTVEPRKNHQLLLHLWRDMVLRGETQVPRLLVIGRRGWENENILDLLDRCEALRGTVTELGPLPDDRAATLLAGARALLFPSFAEGYGLPVAEALAAGVPVICSDLPALREVGGGVPDYLDPLDGMAWRRAILDFARPDSKRRTAQLARLVRWQAPRWDEHFALVDALLEQVTAPAGLPGPLPEVRQPARAPLPAAALEAEASAA